MKSTWEDSPWKTATRIALKYNASTVAKIHVRGFSAEEIASSLLKSPKIMLNPSEREELEEIST